MSYTKRGQRDQTRRHSKSYNRKSKIPKSKRKTQRKPHFSPLRTVVPIAPGGSSVATTKKAFRLARKHGKAGRNSKAILYNLLAAASAASFFPMHPTAAQMIEPVIGKYDRVSGLGADATWTAAYGIGRPHVNRDRNTYRARRPAKKRGKKKSRHRRRRSKNRGGTPSRTTAKTKKLIKDRRERKNAKRSSRDKKKKRMRGPKRKANRMPAMATPWTPQPPNDSFWDQTCPGGAHKCTRTFT